MLRKFFNIILEGVILLLFLLIAYILHVKGLI